MVPTLIFVLFLPAGDVRGFLVGVVVSAYGGLVSILFTVTGTTQRRMGGCAEEWTSAELRKLGSSFCVFDHVDFADGDIDHVVIGPDVALVVETKWTSRDVDVAAGRPSPAVMRWVSDAQTAERRVRLMTRGLVPTVAVLVIWGANVRGIPRGWTHVENVTVVAGKQMAAWRAAGRPRNGGAPHETAAQVLQNYITLRTAYRRPQRRKFAVPRRSRSAARAAGGGPG